MQMVTIRNDDIHRNHPDVLLPAVSRECAPLYWSNVERGDYLAKDMDVTILGLCRNSMPFIEVNVQRVEKLAERFKTWRAFVYENDSADDTDGCLRAWAERCENATVECVKHDRPQLSHEKSRRRTDALAEYRQRCLEWARENRPAVGVPHVVIVVDLDTWGGWSDDGVMTGLAWMEHSPHLAAMASVSTVEMVVPNAPGGRLRIHYDAWAFRWNWWGEHDMPWFPHWLPPVGSRPVMVNSAFGGLAIYRQEAFYAGTYTGGDCEHVNFHRSIHKATGMSMAINPSQRCVMTWIPEESKDAGDRLDGLPDAPGDGA